MAVRFEIDGMIDRLVTPVKADCMIRTGPDDAFDTAKPRRFGNVPHTDYIGAKDHPQGLHPRSHRNAGYRRRNQPRRRLHRGR